MQDRFKVRVWNTLVKKFSYFDKPEMQIGTDGFDSGLIFPLSDNSNLYMGKYSEPQFCTGLKDKNCKLIYEKDIIQCSYANEKVIGVVVWSAEYMQFSICYNNSLYGFVAKRTNEKVEIIGNIYENPELLNGGVSSNGFKS